MNNQIIYRKHHRGLMRLGQRITAVIMMITMLSSLAVLFAGCDRKDEGITSLEQLDQPGIRIGVATDTGDFRVVEEEFPNAEIVYTTDLMSAFTTVAQGKIDAYVGNRLNMELAIRNGLKGVRIMDASVGEGNVGGVAVSPHTKIPDLTERINEFLRQINADGTLDDIRRRWFGTHELIMPDIPEAKDPKLHLIVGTTGLSEPFTCYVDGELAGYDIELAKRFALWMGASLEFKVYDYDGVVAAAHAGDVDCIFANLYITPERQEVLEFSDPTYAVDIGVMVKDESSDTSGFLSSVKESFYKTFIRENRWKMFAESIGTTMLITVLSIIFGTLTGFAVFMLCRSGNRAANAVTRFFIWLIDGMPVVVLLMILYYVVFSRAKLSGVTISVLAFTLIFASSVFSMLKTGVAAVGTGQMEAAYSLGYPDRKAFYKIILPQAIPHVIPFYKGQITALIKATAVVGYVAVQDLTKMGDIVRSRTYEAFFPLIAVAVMYFILAGILILIVNRVEVRTIPGRRTGVDHKMEIQKEQLGSKKATRRINR